MTIEQSLLEAVRELSPEKQQELLEHAGRLRSGTAQKKPFKSVKGLWAGMEISISSEEFDELRREMWKDFPREDL
jgi:hypothetical protein